MGEYYSVKSFNCFFLFGKRKGIERIDAVPVVKRTGLCFRIAFRFVGMLMRSFSQSPEDQTQLFPFHPSFV